MKCSRCRSAARPRRVVALGVFLGFFGASSLALADSGQPAGQAQSCLAGVCAALGARVADVRTKLDVTLKQARRRVDNLLGRRQNEMTFIPTCLEEKICRATGAVSSATLVQRLTGQTKRHSTGQPAAQTAAAAPAPQYPFNRHIYDSRGTAAMPEGKTLELSDAFNDQETDSEAAKRANNALAVFHGLTQSLGLDIMKEASMGALRTNVRYGDMDNAAFLFFQPIVTHGSVMHNWVFVGGTSEKGPFKELTQSPIVLYHEFGHGMILNDLWNIQVNLQPPEPAASTSGQSTLATRQRGISGLLASAKRSLDGVVKAATSLPEKAEQTYRGLRNRFDLQYADQSGALNESTADIFGLMAVQFAQKTRIGALKEADWCVGSDAMKETVKHDAEHPLALRNMLNPGTGFNDPDLPIGKDPQVGHMKDLYQGPEDNGGVHINSGIPSRAFALATMQYAKGNPDATLWESTGKAWIQGIRKAGPNATIAEAAEAIYKEAVSLSPKDSALANAFAAGWQEVGITVHR